MRYLPLTNEDRADMLARIGANSIDALFADIPESKLLKQELDLPRGKTEMEVERLLTGLAAKNVSASTVPFFVGAGAYKHHVPATVDHLIQRSEFLTSYTPYQPEIAQGTLQYLFEFQTQVGMLTGMEVANASMYDGSTAAAEAVSLGAITPPGEMGADIVVAEGQSIGNPLSFGGPYVGLFATRQKFVRQMPGRLVGETVDAEGKRGFVLTLSTREQHIRREKATSNICTNSGLCTLAFTAHLTLLGEKGLRQLASLNHARACEAAERLARIPGVELVNGSFFNEFTLKLPVEARPAVHAMVEKGVLGGVSLGRLYPGVEELHNGLVIAVTETATN